MKTKYKLLIIIILYIGTFNLSGQNIIFFTDSQIDGYYDTGLAFPNPPSTLEQTGPVAFHDKIPTSGISFSGANSLKLSWKSKPTGGWNALVMTPDWKVQDITPKGYITFFAYSNETITKAALPKISFKDNLNQTSIGISLGDYNNDLPAGKWTFLKFPIQVAINHPGNENIDFDKIGAVIFCQSIDDDIQHTMLVDDLFAGNEALTLPQVENFSTTGYDSHVELTWGRANGDVLYRVYLSTDMGETYIERAVTIDTILLDFVNGLGNNLHLKYKIKTYWGDNESALETTSDAQTRNFSDEELMEMVQKYTFRYFWDFANKNSGMAYDRSTSHPTVTVGPSGFGVMGIVVAIERGWITRQQGMDRVLKILNFLKTADRYHGAWPHWLNGNTGKTIPFDVKDNGADLVETAFMAQALVVVKNYFDNQNLPNEKELSNLAKELWEGIEWDWFRRGGQDKLYWHWSPNYGWDITFPISGFAETMITYILAASSPTHPVPAAVFHEGWAGNGSIVNGNSYYGYTLEMGNAYGGPLFFIYFSFQGLDPRNLKDKYGDYWKQCVNFAKINHAYCVDNPKNHKGYSEISWGLTPSDDPELGYSEHSPNGFDNGTIAPTRALSCMPYTPDESLAALKHFYRDRGKELFGTMGFYEAFNDNHKWVQKLYLAHDQGPIITMIENYRSGLLWKYFMMDENIKNGLDILGFDGYTTDMENNQSVHTKASLYPNPNTNGVLNITLPCNAVNSTIKISIIDCLGHELIKQSLVLSDNLIKTNVSCIPKGVYIFRMEWHSQTATFKFVKQ